MIGARLDEQVNIPKLIFIGGLVKSPAAGINALCKGEVYIERWNIGVAEATLPRWVLRGVTITVRDNSIHISECGFKVKRVGDQSAQLHG